ncbi:sulfite exporter TauE/SafE family protein [Francisellaceae bacterium]|nr:sulfite exporter TauE/SafE family protein [Francisellaceae bacterium]
MEIIIFICLGMITGVLAGMLGIGGGMIVVPALAFIFNYLGIGSEYSMQYAAGTSLAIMIFTAIATVYKNYKLQRIYLPVFKQTIGWIIVSLIIGAIIARFLDGFILGLIFALMLIVLLIKMLRQDKEHKYNVEMNANNINIDIPKKKSFIYGSLIGVKSGLLGIGGGAISIPFLTRYKVPIKIASATTSAFTLPISILGTICYCILGATDHIDLPYSTGYIYWPAVLFIAPLSMVFAVIGTKIATHISPKSIRMIFIILFIILIIKMLIYSLESI